MIETATVFSLLHGMKISRPRKYNTVKPAPVKAVDRSWKRNPVVSSNKLSARKPTSLRKMK